MKRALVVFFSLFSLCIPVFASATGTPPQWFGSTTTEVFVGNSMNVDVTVTDIDAGVFVARFTANDGTNESTHELQITIHEVEEENTLPEWFGPENASTTLGELLEFDITFTDADGDDLVITTELPEGALYDTTAGKFSWTPNATGTFEAIFFAFDGTSTSTHTTDIDVRSPNVPPVNHPPEFIGFNPPATATTTVLY